MTKEKGDVDLARKASAELLGTFMLVFIAVGAAVASLDEIGALGVALAFGFVLLALAYALGPVSGCHVNPAVTLAVLMRRGSPPSSGLTALLETPARDRTAAGRAVIDPTGVEVPV